MAVRVTKRELEALVAEIHRYLETVDAFRAQGREPRWRAEPITARAAENHTRRKTRKRRGSSKPREGG